MAEEVLGSGISPEVANQLKLRESKIGENPKSKDHLLFFNSNGAWVRLASSVDTLTHAESIKLADYPEVLQTRSEQGKEFGDSTLASSNVLFGGMYPDGMKPEGGILSTKWHEPYRTDDNGFQKTDDDGIRESVNVKRGSYHNYQSTGHRPVPGITSVKVASKNTYGTLREAEVSLVVWTVEDLELMQAIYLRPGYSMLLEWGHSLGLGTDDGELIKSIPTFSDFFKSQQKQKDIEQYLISNAKNNSYNYDGMFGYVSNFSWTFRQDGGYDCTVKLISKGSILESLALSFDTGEVYPTDQITDEREETSKEERKSIFHKFKSELNKVNPEPLSAKGLTTPNGPIGVYLENLGIVGNGNTGLYPVKKIFQRDLGLLATGENFSQTLNSGLYGFPINYITEVTNDKEETEKVRGKKVYVPLSVLLDIYNNYIALTDPTQEKQTGTNSAGYKYVQFYNGWQDDDTSTKTPFAKISKFLTTKYHFSINPLVCVIPGQLDNRGIQFQDPFNDCEDLIKDLNKEDLPSTKNIGSIQVSNFDLAVRSAFENKEIRGEKDDILNILVPIDYVTSLLDTLSEQNKDSDQNTSNNMTVFMQRLLKEINGSLGGVNDLDISYDESENLFFIVDRRVTPTTPDAVPKINLAGVNSTLSSLNISSKISSNISSQISIAAQGGNQGTKDNIGPLLQWNRGLIDRHLPVKDPKRASNGPEERKIADKDRLKKWLKDYMEVWKTFKVKTREPQEAALDTGDKFDGVTYTVNYTVTPKVLDETSLDNLTSLSSYHKIYSQKYVTQYYFKHKDSIKPPPGVIPVELSFTTIGIAGLKIGQSFGFSRGVLPKSYSDDFGFIITGLDHNITGNRWTTDVKTQFFCTKNPPEKVIQEYNQLFTCTPFVPEPDAPPETGVELGVSQEWWTLVAICFAENYPDKYQGYADVAQSIYNRANAEGKYSNGSVVKNILAPGQYEPTFIGIKTNPDAARFNTRAWANISDINTAGDAIRAYYRARLSDYIPSSTQVFKWLKKCSEVLQNETYRQAAANFVGSRTEFLAGKPNSGNAVGMVERTPANEHNTFFWNYDGRTVYYDKGNTMYTDFNIVKPPPEAVVT